MNKKEDSMLNAFLFAPTKYKCKSMITAFLD